MFRPNVTGQITSAVSSMYRPRANSSVQGALSSGPSAVMAGRPAALQRRLSRFSISEDDINQQKKKRRNDDEDQVIRDLIARRKKGLGY